jgi:hypothetical protein
MDRTMRRLVLSVLIDLLEKNCKLGHLEKIKRAPIVNDVVERAFNYSLEEPILRKYGSLVNITSPWSFFTIQPCIRMSDFSRVKRGELYHSPYFNIAPVDFQLSTNPDDLPSLHESSIKRLCFFLIDKIGLDPRNFIVRYFPGGYIDEIDKRIRIKRYFEEDKITYKVFTECGLSPQQFEPVRNSDTLLFTFPKPIEFWVGYRYEVLYKLENGNLIEIATGEAVKDKRIVDEEGNIIDIQPMNGCIVPVVVGIERLLIAANNLNNIFECEHVVPIFHFINEKVKNTITARVLTSSLQAVHIIVTDGGHWNNLNPPRREDFSLFSRAIFNAIMGGSLSIQDLEFLLRKNAELQFWIPELRNSVEQAIDEIVYKEKNKKK